MMTCAKWGQILVALALGLGSASPGIAAVLASGQSASLGGIAISSDPSLGGTILAETTTTFPALTPTTDGQFDGGQLFAAELHSTVVRESGTGTLDFYYQIINNNDFSVDPIGHATVAGYAQFTTDADYRTDAGGLYQPDAASRDATGDAVTFTFSPPAHDFTAAQATSSLLIRTNATDFSANGLATIYFWGIEGEGAPPVPGQGTLFTYAPLEVPEPSSLAVFSVAALCLWGRFGSGRRCR